MGYGGRSGGAGTWGCSGSTDSRGRSGSVDSRGCSGSANTWGRSRSADSKGRSGSADSRGRSGSVDSRECSGSADSRGHSGSADSSGRSGSADAWGGLGKSWLLGALDGTSVDDVELDVTSGDKGGLDRTSGDKGGLDRTSGDEGGHLRGSGTGLEWTMTGGLVLLLAGGLATYFAGGLRLAANGGRFGFRFQHWPDRCYRQVQYFRPQVSAIGGPLAGFWLPSPLHCPLQPAQRSGLWSGLGELPLRSRSSPSPLQSPLRSRSSPSPLQSPLRSRTSPSPLQSPLRSRSSQSPLQSAPQRLWTSPRKFCGGGGWGISGGTHHGSRSPLICHGCPNPLIHHGCPSSLIHHGCPNPLIHHGRPRSMLHHWSRNGHRPGGHLPCLHVPWGLQSAHPASHWTLFGAGRACSEGEGNVRPVSPCLVSLFLFCPYMVLPVLVLSSLVHESPSVFDYSSPVSVFPDYILCVYKFWVSPESLSIHSSITLCCLYYVH